VRTLISDTPIVQSLTPSRPSGDAGGAPTRARDLLSSMGMRAEPSSPSNDQTSKMTEIAQVGHRMGGNGIGTDIHRWDGDDKER